jgi:serine/threonine protein kinase/tetratricopeptide (TPR) repeat protein
MSESQVFAKALKLTFPSEQAAYLDEACAGNPELRAGVEALLRAYAGDPGFLEQPLAPLVATAELPAAPGSEGETFPVDGGAAERAGVVIGPYKLLEQIGEGGFGVVFMAEQTEPVRRKVALKVLKPGMDTRQVVARFEAERQALALMDHPNIARVLDGGQTSNGRPYFVMDLVKGLPITEYCDQAQLAPRERLELCVHLCQAVQHAHQKGLIHRDLKPSNVLVTLHDGTPLVKVIDFGIAKALGQSLTDKTLFTGYAQMVGTPLYMSPEQAALSNIDVDTRSDVYSLGVVLYELLTGTTPFDKERLEVVGYDELRRIIREEEPPKPSTRISTLGQAASTVSALRRSDPRRLSQLCRGELDWIVMKCLEKDRNRRYESASAFAADVQRYLNDEPVLACPPSAWYRLRKFVRRHQAGVLTTATVFLVVLLAAAGAGWVWWDRAGRLAQTDRTVSVALARAGQSAGQAEGRRAATSQEGKEVLELWGQADAALAEAEGALHTGAADEPMRQRVADVRQRLAEGRRTTEQQQEQALRRETLLRDLEAARLQRATWVADSDAFDNAGAAAKYRAAFAAYGLEVRAGHTAELARRIRVEEPAVRDALIVALYDWGKVAEYQPTDPPAGALHALAAAADDDPWRKRYRAAMTARDRAVLRELSIEARRLPLPPASVAMLADSLFHAGERDEGKALLRWARGQHPADFWVHFYLGTTLTLRSGGSHLAYPREITPVELEEAIGCHRAALALRPEAAAAHYNLGCDLGYKGLLDESIAETRKAIDLGPTVARFHDRLGSILRDKGRLDEAIAECREAIRLQKDYPSAHYNLGRALQEKGQLDEAIAEYRKAIQLKKDYPLAHYNLGIALKAKGMLDEAIKEYREAIRLQKDYPEAHNNLGNALRTKGQLDEAIAEYREAIRLQEDLVEAHNNLGIALLKKGRLDEAIEKYRDAIRLQKDYPLAHYNLGIALLKKGRLDEAIAEYREAIRIKPEYVDAHNALGLLLCDNKHDYAGAIVEFREAIRLKNHFADAHYNLGNALLKKGQLDEAIEEYREALRLQKDDPEVHCNLGHTLRKQGEFRQALEELRRGHELGSRKPRWPYPSGRWVRQCERLVELEGRLPGFFAGNIMPAGPAERIELAEMCSLKRLHRAAARFYEEAFTAQPGLVARHRYNAACHAAMAACGQGKDADQLEAPKRARLRCQALDWLRADLDAWGRLLDKSQDKSSWITQKLRHWQEDGDLARVRGPEPLAKLPADERQQWEKLWQDVAATLARAEKTTTSKGRVDTK